MLPVIPKFPHAGQLVAATKIAEASWKSSLIVSAAGGGYRLCWCAAFDCMSEGSQAHFVDAGTLHLLVDPASLELRKPVFRVELVLSDTLATTSSRLRMASVWETLSGCWTHVAKHPLLLALVLDAQSMFLHLAHSSPGEPR